MVWISWIVDVGRISRIGDVESHRVERHGSVWRVGLLVGFELVIFA